jgi:diadenylate cyclase
MALWQTVLDTLLHVTFVDVIDVGIMAYIIYRLALAVRGTRVIPLLKGTLVVLVLVWASTGLPTLNWILRRIFPVGFIALIIIFQPELRVTLERLGRGGLFRGTLLPSTNPQLERVLSEVMDACEDFAAKRIGALIVLERAANLLDVTRTGKTINGVVSSELLATIFAPRSPLHDGAVVIREDRIVAAGCALPHSENPSLSATIGMRHRAALGLSERNDAVCIVVSEETGVISLAVEGALRPNLERIELTERLLQLFEGRQSSSRFFFWRK